MGTAEYDQLLEVLREARKRANVTQRALSVALGRSATYIDKIERGVRRVDVIEFCRIAKALSLDSRELFNDFVEKAGPF